MTSQKFDTVNQAYTAIIKTVLASPDYAVSPRGLPCQELYNYQFTVATPSSQPIVTNNLARNKAIKKYQAAEKRLYLSGERRASVWAATASKFWAKLADADGLVNSNYGWLIFYNKSLPNRLTPWEWARQSLLADRDTRQAFIRFSLPEHQQKGVKDQVCTFHMQFMVREGHLHGTAVMRSNDVVKGLVYDMPWFCYLLERMAKEVQLPVGSYTHFAHSLHLYDKDREVATSMAAKSLPQEKLPEGLIAKKKNKTLFAACKALGLGANFYAPGRRDFILCDCRTISLETEQKVKDLVAKDKSVRARGGNYFNLDNTAEHDGTFIGQQMKDPRHRRTSPTATKLYCQPKKSKN